MKTKFPNYEPTDKQEKLVERLEAQGFEFPLFELFDITDEIGFNKWVDFNIQRLRDLFDETIHNLERLHYDVRTVGPYMPYPSTPKD
jgi:hypothetical protein